MTPKADNRTDFIKECKSGALDGVVAVYRTFGSVNITGRVDEELVKALPKGLKFISHNGGSLVKSRPLYGSLHCFHVGMDKLIHDVLFALHFEAVAAFAFYVYTSQKSVGGPQCPFCLPISLQHTSR